MISAVLHHKNIRKQADDLFNTRRSRLMQNNKSAIIVSPRRTIVDSARIMSIMICRRARPVALNDPIKGGPFYESVESNRVV